VKKNSLTQYRLMLWSLIAAFSVTGSAESLAALPLAVASVDPLAKAVTASRIQLTTDQVGLLRQQKLTAALVWHGASPWISAVTAGATAVFKELGVQVVAVTDAQFDPAKQASDIENVAMLKPDFVLSLVVDPASAKNAYQQLVNTGSQLVLLSNPVPGFVLGKDYAGIVTDDMFGMGRQAADVLAQSFPDASATQPLQIGMIYHDADYFITNNRDQAFRQQLAKYPQLQLIASKGFVREQETAEIAAALLLQQPKLQAIYVSWDAAAEGVVEALRASGRKDIKVITHDLGVNNLLDLAKGGNMLATIADQPYLIGQTMARVAALSELGVQTPAFTLVPFGTVTQQNIAAGWQQAFQSPLPPLLQQVLATKGVSP
jgi:ribose transport system substrate-binding protein